MIDELADFEIFPKEWLSEYIFVGLKDLESEETSQAKDSN